MQQQNSTSKPVFLYPPTATCSFPYESHTLNLLGATQLAA